MNLSASSSHLFGTNNNNNNNSLEQREHFALRAGFPSQSNSYKTQIYGGHSFGYVDLNNLKSKIWIQRARLKKKKAIS